MILNPGDSNNYGPHCRNCHTGASSCNQCHGTAGGGYTATFTAPVAGRTNYTAQSYIKTSATTVGSKCLDGGFSWPHRTLGYNMLKDELWGVDFDGTPIAVGATRGTSTIGTIVAQYDDTSADASSGIPAVASDNGVLLNAATENLDSVCIDCHGDATYWNGTTDRSSAMDSELLLRGLP